MKFARRHLLECCGVKDVIYPAHGSSHAARISHIANVELELGMVIALAHVILLFLIAAEYANFRNFSVKKTFKDCIAKRPGSAGNQKNFIRKHFLSFPLVVLLHAHIRRAWMRWNLCRHITQALHFKELVFPHAVHLSSQVCPNPAHTTSAPSAYK